ncbi:MAG: hypothetical protein ACK6D3_14185 [Planctomycetaceae bacterium]|jgi:hypothetical protein
MASDWNGQADEQDEEHQRRIRLREPAWVRATLWLLPEPLFAVTLSAVCLVIALFLVVYGTEARQPKLFYPAAASACVSALVAGASFVRSRMHRKFVEAVLPDRQKPSTQPTEAIVSALVFFCSWFQLVTMFGRPRPPGPGQRAVAVGVTLLASLYFRWRGYDKLREYFTTAHQGETVSWFQVLVVIVTFLAMGAYWAFLLV